MNKNLWKYNTWVGFIKLDDAEVIENFKGRNAKYFSLHKLISG